MEIEIKKLIPVIEEADKIALRYFNKGVSVQLKQDNSPVSEADTKISEFICTQLQFLYPSIPILSEEEVLPELSERQKWKSYFILDPLDGTKEFISGHPEFTINLAWVKDSQLMGGIVSAPALGKLYYGSSNEGSFLKDSKHISSLPLVQKTNIIKVATSVFHPDLELEPYIQSRIHSSFEYRKIGSSLKFCYLAEGEIDIYPRLQKLKIWDVAAGMAVLAAAGGKVFDLEKNKFHLDNTEIRVKPFIATAPHFQLNDFQF